MGIERYYQVKNLSNLINTLKRYKSTTHKPNIVNKSSINPWFVTGFTDAEGSFSILIQHNQKYKFNWRVKIIFAIGLHNKDIELLQNIKSYFGVGNIHKHGKDSIQYRVESIKDIQVIINHFDMYPLVSTKKVNYTLFKEAFNLVKLNDHTNEKGLLKLVGLKSYMNLGLNPKLKQAFPDFDKHSLIKPEYAFSGIQDPYWVAGFVSGDGSFGIKIASGSTAIGNRTQLRFAIGLNIIEKDLILSLANYFKRKDRHNNSIVNINKNDKMPYVYYKKNSISFEVTNFSNIYEIIIPFFIKYPILGVKNLDLSDFIAVANMIKDKKHLTSEGFNKIMKIRDLMNRSRI